MKKVKIERFCFIDANKGPVELRLSVEEHLIAGGEFQLISQELPDLMRKWKLTSEDNIPARKLFIEHPKELHKKKLIWQVLCCSKNTNVFKGIVRISIIQDNSLCQMNLAAEKYLDNIPPCKIKQVQSYSDSFVFIAKNIC